MSEGKPAFSIADLAPSHEASAGLHYRDPNTLRTPSGPGESVYNYAEDDMDQEPIEISKDDGTTTFRLDGGYIRIKENSRWAQGAHSVVDFTVREDRRRRGIGRRLVSEVIRYYPDDEISAQVTGSNSLSLFLSEGFEYFGDNPEGPRQDFASYGTVNLRFNPRPELGKSITKKESLKSLHKKAFGLQMSAVPGNEAAIAGQSFHDEENREASFHTGFGGPDNIDSEEAWSPANIERKVMVNEIDDKEPINIPYKTESKDYFSFLETGRLGRTRKITRGSVMNNLENERVELTKLAAALRSVGHDKYASGIIDMVQGAGGSWVAAPASNALVPASNALAAGGSGGGGIVAGTRAAAAASGGGGGGALATTKGGALATKLAAAKGTWARIAGSGTWARIAGSRAAAVVARVGLPLAAAWGAYKIVQLGAAVWGYISANKDAHQQAGNAMIRVRMTKTLSATIVRYKKEYGASPNEEPLSLFLAQRKEFLDNFRNEGFDFTSTAHFIGAVSSEEWNGYTIEPSGTEFGDVELVTAVWNEAFGPLMKAARPKAALKAEYDAFMAVTSPLTAPSSAPSPNAQPSGPWAWGSNAVKKVQVALNEKFTAGLKGDGKWGDASKAAWKKHMPGKARPGTEAEALTMISGGKGEADPAALEALETGPKAAETEVPKGDFMEYLTQDWEGNPKTNRDKDKNLIAQKSGGSISENIAEQMYSKSNWNKYVSALYRLDNADGAAALPEVKEEPEALTDKDFFNPPDTDIWMRKSDGSLFWAPKGDTSKMMTLTQRTSRLSGNRRETGSMTYAEGNAMRKLLNKEVKSDKLTDAQRDDYIDAFRAQRNEERPGGLSGKKKRERASRMGKR